MPLGCNHPGLLPLSLSPAWLLALRAIFYGAPAPPPHHELPRLIPLLASFLFAIALVHANGPFLLTAILPGVPAVLAPHHPPGLGEGEQTLK